MKTTDVNGINTKEEVAELLFDEEPTIQSIGHKRLYQRVRGDSRSQSLPNCLSDKNQVQLADCYDSSTSEKTPPPTPTSDQWFKTWPECYDKLKTSPDDNIINSNNTHIQANGIKNKISLSEALQNISLAYSPVTKQLHLVEKKQEVEQVYDQVDSAVKKKGHKRTEAGSFSSTISSLSDPSPSGSLLDADERSLNGFEHNIKPRKKSLTNFFTKNLFSWKTGSSSQDSGSNLWKFFSKNSQDTCGGSPIHVVSSTALIQNKRPSNLPAKTLEEEQRHRQQYKAIIAAAKKKEAQITAARQKLQKLQLQQEEHNAAATKHFTQYVLSNWEVMHKTKKTIDLWWQGLPSSVRGKVWRLAIGNELNVTTQLYEICLSRAQNRLNSPEPSSHSESDVDQESSMDVIQLDISRTFPHLCIFQEGGPYSDILHSLLAAYVCYRPDVGYVQGMSFIAAILILNMEPFDAFICFANLLNQPLHLSAFTLNQMHMQAYYNAYNKVFLYNLPKLYNHFENSGLTPDLYLLDWIYTIFAKAMPLDVACRVWDIFLRDGYEFIFRTALGILHLNQDTLIDMDFLHGAQFLTRLPDDLSSDQLFKSIQTVTTTIGKLNFYQIVDKCMLSLDEAYS